MSEALPAEHVLGPRPCQFELVGPGKLCVSAPAKINLNLLVGPRRDDGFHEIDSLVSRISLYDRLELSERSDGRVTLKCGGANCGPAEENLALRAARALAAQADGGGVDIVLTKRIATGAGLGGGSSDAAAVLRGVNRLWGGLVADRELVKMSSALGSDVPFFLGPPAARVTGRGAKLQPVVIHPFAALLVVPEFSCATKEVYRVFDRAPQQMADQLEASMLSSPPSKWRDRLVNQLAKAAEAAAPGLAGLRVKLAAQLGLPVCLTGSGSAMFALYDSVAEARDALTRICPPLTERCCIVQSNPW